MAQYSGMWTLSQVSQAVKNQTWTGLPPAVVEYLIVAGGGGGGGYGGAGGGAGGLLAGFSGVTAGSQLWITISGGGAAGSSGGTGGTIGFNSVLIINGYFQVIDGYKPNVQTGTQKVKQALTSNTSYAMSDRTTDTHPWYLAASWGSGTGPTSTTGAWIPSYESDYGLLCIPGNDDFLTNNTVVTMRIAIYSSAGVPTTQDITLNGYDIEALPVYPANLNDWTGLTVKPSLLR